MHMHCHHLKWWINICWAITSRCKSICESFSWLFFFLRFFLWCVVVSHMQFNLYVQQMCAEFCPARLIDDRSTQYSIIFIYARECAQNIDFSGVHVHDLNLIELPALSVGERNNQFPEENVFGLDFPNKKSQNCNTQEFNYSLWRRPHRWRRLRLITKIYFCSALRVFVCAKQIALCCIPHPFIFGAQSCACICWKVKIQEFSAHTLSKINLGVCGRLEWSFYLDLYRYKVRVTKLLLRF